MEVKFEVNLKEIEEKKQTLERIKAELKSEFIGIDYIIEELIDYIQIWYLMPEVLTRPIIVNLWGMTGVGKTDLVRRLVSKLNYQDRFAEVELNNSEHYSWKNTVGALLEANGINNGKPAIVLFDEIQRFNTLDPQGNPLQNTRFQDFWELLSDGRLAKREGKEDIDYYVNNFRMNAYNQKRQKPEEGAPPLEEPTVGIWQAPQLKKTFDLDQSIIEIADMKEVDVLQLIEDRRSKKKIYEAVDHSRTLIIVSGNLDDAFSMAGEIAEADIDANIFHAFTQKITLVDIKHSLARKFKPEQVARFGNIHLIYRSLQKKHFVALIAAEVTKIVAKNKKLFGITLTVKSNIDTLIYQNGVFPVQGVRPVFSSVIDILETNLTKFIYEALLSGQKKIEVDYSFEKKEIQALIGKKIVTLPYEGRVDKIRQSNLDDVVAGISVHECGHAVAYSILFGLAPLQLKSKVASTYVGGFTFPHQIYLTKTSIINKIKVLLAGGIAEEIIFGPEQASIGRSNDREQATILAVDYIRKYAFEREFQAYYISVGDYSMNFDDTDTAIEMMMKRLSAETTELLNEHKPYLLKLSQALRTSGNMKATEVQAVAQAHGVDAVVKEEGFLFIEAYGKDL
jgi:hypothetical protein